MRRRPAWQISSRGAIHPACRAGRVLPPADKDSHAAASLRASREHADPSLMRHHDLAGLDLSARCNSRKCGNARIMGIDRGTGASRSLVISGGGGEGGGEARGASQGPGMRDARSGAEPIASIGARPGRASGGSRGCTRRLTCQPFDAACLSASDRVSRLFQRASASRRSSGDSQLIKRCGNIERQLICASELPTSYVFCGFA